WLSRERFWPTAWRALLRHCASVRPAHGSPQLDCQYGRALDDRAGAERPPGPGEPYEPPCLRQFPVPPHTVPALSGLAPATPYQCASLVEQVEWQDKYQN